MKLPPKKPKLLPTQPDPPMQPVPLPVLLFQARLSQPRDEYGLFWTDGKLGQCVTACAADGTLPSAKRYPWESTGLAAVCEVAEAISRAEGKVERERRQYRLVSINWVSDRLRYLVEWVSK